MAESLDKTSYRHWWRDLRDRMRAAGRILDPLKEERIKELAAKYEGMSLFKGRSSSEVGQKGRQVRRGNYIQIRRKSDGHEFYLNRSFQDAGLTRKQLEKALAKNPAHAVVCGDAFEQIFSEVHHPTGANGNVVGQCEAGLLGRQVANPAGDGAERAAA